MQLRATAGTVGVGLEREGMDELATQRLEFQIRDRDQHRFDVAYRPRLAYAVLMRMQFPTARKLRFKDLSENVLAPCSSDRP